MALVLIGRHKGKEVKIVQWANNWIMVEHDEIDSAQCIMSPTSLQYTFNERDRLNASKSLGMFWSIYEWNKKNPLRLSRKRFKKATL